MKFITLIFCFFVLAAVFTRKLKKQNCKTLNNFQVSFTPANCNLHFVSSEENGKVTKLPKNHVFSSGSLDICYVGGIIRKDQNEVTIGENLLSSKNRKLNLGNNCTVMSINNGLSITYDFDGCILGIEITNLKDANLEIAKQIAKEHDARVKTT